MQNLKDRERQEKKIIWERKYATARTTNKEENKIKKENFKKERKKMNRMQTLKDRKKKSKYYEKKKIGESGNTLQL